MKTLQLIQDRKLQIPMTVSWYPAGFCRNEKEFRFCLGCLIQRGLIENLSKAGIQSWDYRITPAGWTYLSGVGAECKEQGFVAMAFKPDLNVVWTDGIFHGIQNAGYPAHRGDNGPR